MMLSWLFSDPLPVGAPAPEFTAATDKGETVRSSALRGKNFVLVFYPGDDTPGCTKQLCEFRDNWSALTARGVLFYGVNPAGPDKHARFREKFHLPFPLLVDQGQKIAALYHADGLWVKRTVYLVGPDGVIRFSRRGMPKPAEVLAAAR
ncbi:MAG TPA: peroxiredoxin [Candidatus Acidoferrales bacterium]|nr:peroxiredoxin [Candidatus Acidoferrales bacterium]